MPATYNKQHPFTIIGIRDTVNSSPREILDKHKQPWPVKWPDVSIPDGTYGPQWQQATNHSTKDPFKSIGESLIEEFETGSTNEKRLPVNLPVIVVAFGLPSFIIICTAILRRQFVPMGLYLMPSYDKSTEKQLRSFEKRVFGEMDHIGEQKGVKCEATESVEDNGIGDSEDDKVNSTNEPTPNDAFNDIEKRIRRSRPSAMKQQLWVEDTGKNKIRKVIQGFNNHCRINHIRFAYVSLAEKRDRLSRLLSYGYIYTPLRYNEGLSAPLPEEKDILRFDKIPRRVNGILHDFIAKLWPEELRVRVLARNYEIAMQIVHDHSSDIFHESTMATILKEAVAQEKVEAVKEESDKAKTENSYRKQQRQFVESLLDCGLHPDVRLRTDDCVAFDNASDDMKRLLYSKGSRVFKPPGDSWLHWTGFECKTPWQNDPQKNAPVNDTSEDEDIRALIVDIFNPKQNFKKSNEGDKVQEPDETSTDQGSGHNIAGHEYHRVAHPTIHELLKKGPDSIMGDTPVELSSDELEPYRWIHLPMNHMEWLRKLVSIICDKRHKEPKTKHDQNNNQTEIDFWSLKGCADAIFQERYWLGQQETLGTDDCSTIHSLQPSFRRLGLVRWKHNPSDTKSPDPKRAVTSSLRTGYTVAVPFIHFDTYHNVQMMKGEVAFLRDARASYMTDEKSIGRPRNSTIDVIRKDLFARLPVHCRRTLSQYYYYSKLQAPKQVITEHFESQWPREEPLTLMVDQLWMLVLRDGTIITCFPSQMGGVQRQFPYIYTDIVEELLCNLRSDWRSPLASQLDLAFMIMQQCIGFFFNQRVRFNRRFRFLNMYEQLLSDMAADEVACFNKLMNIVDGLPETTSRDYKVKARGALEELLGLSKKFGIMKKLETLKHICREVNIILAVVKEQSKVIEQMADGLQSKDFIGVFPRSPELEEKRQRRKKKLEQRQQILLELDTKAKVIFQDFEQCILRKEQQVQNIQAYFSNKMNVNSYLIGTVALIFTFVASLFTPLSFLTSFFALDIVELPHVDGDVRMPLSFVAKWILGVGFGTFVGIVICSGVILWVVRSRVSERSKSSEEQKAADEGRYTKSRMDYFTEALHLAKVTPTLKNRKAGPETRYSRKNCHPASEAWEQERNQQSWKGGKDFTSVEARQVVRDEEKGDGQTLLG